MRTHRRVPHHVCLLALLASLLALPTAVSAQQPTCADYASAAAAQFALDINPALAASLDPDGNGTACDHTDSTTTTNPTSPSLQLPSDTPTPTGQQPQATADVVDQQPTTSTTTTQQTGSLDGSLGATQLAFETIHGAPIEELPSDTNPSILGRVYTPPAGMADLFVIYWEDQAAIVLLTPAQPWTGTDAAAHIGNYVPTDVTSLPQPEVLPDGSYLLPVSSQILGSGVTADMMTAAGIPGVPGDMYVLLVVDGTDLVTEVEIGIGNGDNVRQDAAEGTTTTTTPTPVNQQVPPANPTPTPGTTTTTTTDATAFLQQTRAEVNQYGTEIDELRAIIGAGTFTEAETQRLSEIIVSWMAIDTTPLTASPEHAQIANLLQQVRTDLSTVGLTLFTAISTGDTSGISGAANTLSQIEANLDTIDQQLISLGF